MTNRERMRPTVTGVMGTGNYRRGRTGSVTSPSSLVVPIFLLLLSSGSVLSQSKLNTTTVNADSSAISEERSGSVVSPVIDSPIDSLLATSKRLVEGSGIETLNVDNNAVVSESSESKGGEVAERGGLEAKEPENAEIAKSNVASKFLPEFSEKEAHDENGELEEENDYREPTTSPTGNKDMEDKYDKDSSDVYDLNEIEKKSRENNFSLINDTNVNYHAGNRGAEVGEEVVILGETDPQDIDTKPEATTESKLMLTSPVTMTGNHNDTSSLEAVAGKNLSDYGGEASLNREIIKGERTKDDKSNEQSARGQTDDSVSIDSTKGQGSSRRLNISNQEEGLSDLEPYPYARGAKIHGDGINRTDTLLPTSTEEASALENTIGRRENDGGTVVTVSVSESLLTSADGDGTARAKLPDPEDSKSSWKTSSSTSGPEVNARDATTPGIESTVSYGGILNVSNFSEDPSPDVYGGSGNVNGTTIMTASTTIMTTSTTIMTMTTPIIMATTTTTPDYAGMNNNTAQPMENFVTSVVTDEGESKNSTLVTIDKPIGGTSPSIISSLSDTTTEKNFDSRDNGLFLTSTEVATAGAATPVARMVEITTSPSSMPTDTLQRSTNDITTGGMQETEESSRPNVPIDLTTSGVEYEFIGLTESTVSPKYVTTPIAGDEISPLSSASYVETSTWISTVISSSPDSLSSLSVLTAEEGSVEETSTDPSSTAAEMETVKVSTTETLTLESVVPDKASNETEATTVTESESTEASTMTDASSEGTMSATSENGRSVDSPTSRVPETLTPLENSSTTRVHWTESPSPSTIANDTWESTRPRVTSASPTLASSTETSPSTTQYPGVNVGSEGTEEEQDVTRRPGSRAFSEDDATVLVRIIFEGTWLDVCPYLPILRQSLADLLTSGLEKYIHAGQIIFRKNPCTEGFVSSSITTEFSVTTLLLYVVDKNGNLNPEMTKILPSLYNRSPLKQQQIAIRSFQLVQDGDSGNAIAVVVVSCVALICLVLLAGLLFIMRKRQTRFNYGERCRPVSLDAYSLDSVSAYNSVRGRKAAARASKRSYGNPTFEDSTVTPSHPLNFAGLSAFCEERDKIAEEFASIPQVTARIDELPAGAEVKNRYANVVPLPETRVSLTKLGNDPLTEYINASYVRGPKNATRYYIACQAPIESTVTDFWRMIWEQQTKVVIMLTDLVENGVEKCAEYVPPSEVTDCHRLYGDYQVTLKKRETKERYAISTLHLKNLENNTFREVSHIWYLWPANGVLSDAAGLIAVLLEARALQRGGPGPVVVHCSPGTGRTGTLIALDLAIRQYEITRTVDVPRVVCTIRRDRAGAVQTKEQYGFIYKALNLYATKLAGGALES